MNQLSLDLPRCKTPPRGTQCYTLLQAMKCGERLTVAKALSEYGVYALSQRMGDLRRAGWPVKSRTIEVKRGTHVAEYWMDT